MLTRTVDHPEPPGGRCPLVQSRPPEALKSENNTPYKRIFFVIIYL